MARTRLLWLALGCGLLASAACGGGSDASAHVEDANPTESSPSAAVATPVATQASTATSAPAPATPAATAVVLNPSIEDALSCREPAEPPSLGDGTNAPLQRYDLTDFPLAACNDGSPAVLYFRPSSGAANRNDWVIVLEGGGSCGTPDDCANRWCGVDTNFSSSNMSTDYALNGLGANGILARRSDNPWGDWNQVVVRYCSSDAWTGRNPRITIDATDPGNGQPVSFDIAFSGSYVFEATLQVLRQDGVDPLVYRNSVAMPDLDHAEHVVFAGGSAGGAGVIFNLDRLADTLHAAGSTADIRGFIEAIVGPDLSLLGFEQTTGCKERGACTYEGAMQNLYAANVERGQLRWADESCLDWHAKNDPGTEWRCYDMNYVLANHVTTPFFIRTSLADGLRSTESIAAGYTTPDGEPLTVLAYGVATASYLHGLRDAMASGIEQAAIAELPGIFAPVCPTHYTLLDTGRVYGTKVEAGGAFRTLFETWNAWLEGDDSAVVITSAPRTDICPND